MEMASRGRAKRRHLSASECAQLGQNLRGPLAQPLPVSHSSLDPSRGLYPRTPTKRRRADVDGVTQQNSIRRFFPVKSILHSSPQKKVMEEGPDGGAEPQDIPDDLLEGLTDSMFMDDEEMACFPPVKEEQFAGTAAVKQEGFEAAVSVKEEPISQGGAAQCSIWGYQAPRDQSKIGPIRVKLERVEDDDDDEDYPVDPLPDAHYGLLGSSEGRVEPQGQLGDLPDEILRVLLGLLPAEDLYSHVSLVCHRWRAIIKDPLFVPWKKLYYQYQKGERNAVKQVTSILTDNNITHKEDLCVLNMIKYMSQFNHSSRVEPEEVLLCIRAHPLFPQAQACMKHRLPELPEIQGGPNPWSAMVLILLLADGVKDVQNLVTLLKMSGCLQSPGGVSEYLCCVAVLLLAMMRSGIKISNRCHYNIFYVLHLMENSRVAAQSGVDIEVTHEQQQILNHDIQPGHVVKIMAFAGTGKTSTLVKYAQHRPHLDFLYVAFNKSTATEAKRSFPGNVDCKTVHSLAFGAIGRKYQALKKLSGNMRPFSVAWVLPEGLGGYVNAKVVTQTIKAFFASPDEFISIDHVPQEYKNTNGQMKQPTLMEKQRFANEAQKIWNKMRELKPTKEHAYHMTHDGYLKLWQMQKPRLEKYDVIFVDEAQDCTPAIMDILLYQHCGKILVGDPHQQIYTFRGAINALQEASHTHLYYLTQSFRFGPEIAYVGATILCVCKGVKKMLVGANHEGSVRGEERAPNEPTFGSEHVRGQREGTVAILSRCNVTVFDQAVKLTSSSSLPKIHIVGGVDHFGLNKILDIWVLMQPENERKAKNLTIGDYFIRSFCREKIGGYAGLKKYAIYSEDRELEGKLAVVEKYSHRIPELVERITSCAVSTAQCADYILGTVHKSKGLEFDRVIVTDDFTKIPCARHNLHRLSGFATANVPDDEWNLLYVAVTRAKKQLVITKTIANILTLAGEYFLRPELTSTLVRDGQPPSCSVRECHNHIREDSALTLCKMSIKYSESSEAGGPLCMTCVEQRVGHSAYLIAPPDQVKATPYTEERVDLPVNIAMLMALL